MIYEHLREIIRDYLLIPSLVKYKYRVQFADSTVVHNLNGPAEIWYYNNGNKNGDVLYNNRQKHKLHNPAEIWYYDNGNKSGYVWYINGQKHRLHEPADIWYGDNGCKIVEYWHENGKLI